MAKKNVDPDPDSDPEHCQGGDDTWEDGGERLDIWTGQAVRHAITSFHHIRTAHVPSPRPISSSWGQDGGKGRSSCLWLLSGHTWEDGGEEAGPLYDDAGHVQHQLGQVSQAASRTRLGQEPDTFLFHIPFFLGRQCCGSMAFWGGSGSADPCL